MLKPQASETRELVNLDGIYRFKVDFDRAGHRQEWFKTALETDLEMGVPASYNDVFPDKAIRNHVGYVWYQREVRVPRGWAGERIHVRLDSATHEGMVWVNDVLVAEHTGGYMPFSADITEHVTPGQVFRLTISVNNELTQATIPPGSITVTEDGRRQQSYLHDFYNYAGLHRSLWLYSTPSVAVDDVTVVTGFEGTTGTVGYAIATAGGTGNETVRVLLRDADGAEVAAAEGAEGALVIDGVVLWKPGAAYLYSLTAEIHDGGRLVDAYTLPVGVRTVEVSGKEFLINGEPFYFTGFGMHEDHVAIGKGHSNAQMVNDFQLLDWVGANSFRTSHYPYAEEVMEFADRHGILVIDETAAVGLHLGFGAVFGGIAKPTYVDGGVDANTAANHRQAIRELVARDKNHPSVVIWSIANEPNGSEEGAREYFQPLAELTRQLDPTRPVGYVNVMFDTPDKELLGDLFDVIMLNRYYGWYLNNGDLETAEQVLEKELREWEAKYGKPMIMTEYGPDTMPGFHSIYEQPWSEEYQAAFLAMYHRVFDRVDAMVGEQVWNFADFQTSNGIMRVDGNKKGVFTRDRRPKPAAYALRQRWTALAGVKNGSDKSITNR
ncbi:beta-glucuronidase [Arthrobacter globiformis]|uniref:Beta-glucuronidase n=1 Tax=Arthrobacter globiformis TaxID=1665 RepID=A0A328HGX1_ARTGO|nr:beta-glucuronidase [Arthrobacter globiformis]RAM37858.1 beta-glucuronidase [Arthrobacter globiformis]